MGGSISKETLQKKQDGVLKMNQEIEKTMQAILAKYSEIIKDEIGDYYTKLITILKEPGLSAPPQPNLDIAQIFNQKCTTDLVAVFEKKLTKFPKYAIEKSAMFGTSLEPIMMDIADADGVAKQTLCNNLSQLYVSFLNLIEQSVRSLVSCRTEMDNVMIRLSQSFQGVNGQSGPIANSKANIKWFKTMQNLQETYVSEIKKLDKFFKKMNGITVLSQTRLNKLITDMEKLNSEVQQVPQICIALANEIRNIQTIDTKTADECKRLNIKEENCNQNTIDMALRNLEEAQRLAAQKLSSRRANLSSIPSAMTQNIPTPQALQNTIQQSVQNSIQSAVPQSLQGLQKSLPKSVQGLQKSLPKSLSGLSGKKKRF